MIAFFLATDTVPGFAGIGNNPDVQTAFAGVPSLWTGRRANSWMLGTAVDTSFNAYWCVQLKK